MFKFMKEIELKVLNINLEELTEKLLKLGAKKISEGLVKEKYFDFEDKSIFNNNAAFRLREINNRIELTYKLKNIRKNFKISEETEVIVSDFSIMTEILEKLGLKCIKDREKKRVSFLLNGIKAEIDQYPKIPPYLELEGTEVGIQKVLDLLGYELTNTNTMTSTEVLKSYKVDPYFQKF